MFTIIQSNIRASLCLLFILFVFPLFSQEQTKQRADTIAGICKKQVRGTVYDNIGPLLGVTILIEGTSYGTLSDFDGKFLINAPSGSVISISYVGMETQRFYVGEDYSDGSNCSSTAIIPPIPKKTEMLKTGQNAFVLAPAKSNLHVSYRWGYSRLIKPDHTGSAFLLHQYATLTSPVRTGILLGEGKVPGLSISRTSAAPGAPLLIRLRNWTSIPADAGLYVYNSFSLEHPAGFSNRSQTVSITASKDASASSEQAQYGTDGTVRIARAKAKLNGTKNQISFETSIGSAKVLNSKLADRIHSELENSMVQTNTLQIRNSSEKSALLVTATGSFQNGQIAGSNAKNYNIGFSHIGKTKSLETNIDAEMFHHASDNMYDNRFLSSFYYAKAANRNAFLDLSESKNGLISNGEIRFSFTEKWQLSAETHIAFQGLEKENGHIFGYAQNLLAHSHSLSLLSKKLKLIENHKDTAKPHLLLSSATALRLNGESVDYNEKFAFDNYQLQNSTQSLHQRMLFSNATFDLECNAAIKNNRTKTVFDRYAGIAMHIDELKFFRYMSAVRSVSELTIRAKYSHSFTQKQISNIFTAFSAPELLLPFNHLQPTAGISENIHDLENVQISGINIGTDFSLKKNKFILSVDWYSNRSNNNIGLVLKNGEYRYDNAYSTKNTGFDIYLLYRNREHRFKYGLSAILWCMQSTVTDVYNGDELLIASFEGMRVSAKEGDEYATVYETDSRNEDSKLGKIAPDFETGLSADFEYRGFECSVNGVYQHAGLMLDFTNALLQTDGFLPTDSPEIAKDNTNFNFTYLSFGYNISKIILQHFKLQKLNLSVFADNLNCMGGHNYQANATSMANGYGIDLFSEPQQTVFGGKVLIEF